MGFLEETTSTESDLVFARSNLASFKASFDTELAFFLQEEGQLASSLHPQVAEAISYGTEFATRDGKRLRPALMATVYRGYGGSDNGIVRASAALELFHAGALVLDDIIDHSDLRRGKPTLHRIISDKLEDQDLGEGTAIIVGNILITLAGKAISTLKCDPSRKEKARVLYDAMAVEVNFGQFLDMAGNITPDVDMLWISRTMEYKTARYTVEKPLLIGATLAGASEEELTYLSAYAIPLGIAFQIKDDILGMFGSEQKIGKPIDSDLKEGKKTILVLYTMNQLSRLGRLDDLQRLQNLLGSKSLSKQDFEWVKTTMEEVGAKEFASYAINQLTQDAKKQLQPASITSDAKRFLIGVADLMAGRET